MKFLPLAVALGLVAIPHALRGAEAVPDNLVVEGIPAHTPELRRAVGPYLDFRTAALQSWHPTERTMLITTRFADSAQLHLVKAPGGARRQLTFFNEPVAGARFQPRTGACILFSQDTGGGEFFQLYRLDLTGGQATLLTDGKSRNTGAHWSKSGTRIVYSSTRRNGADSDLWIQNPTDPNSARMLYQAKGGGWSVADWSEDESKLVVGEYVSINQSALHLLDVATGKLEPLTPNETEKVSYADARFAKDGKSVFCTTDRGSEVHRLVRIDLATRRLEVLTPGAKWEVEMFELSPDGRLIAYVANEDGVGVLHLLDVKSGRERPAPKLPAGVIAGLDWHPNGRDLGFTLAHAQSPSDAYSLDVKTGVVTRWTESETGGLDAAKFRSPELIRVKGFDGLGLSGFLYRPDPVKFPGKRPVLVSIHGGPEAQSRPIFQGRNNYYLDQLGIAVLYPNVRGSAGYGKTFLTLDNGMKREDTVKDIGSFLDWIGQDAGLDAARVAVTGGSYGGYMCLASLTHYSDRLKCGIDVVGISDFVTFLERTQEYRRDLRRVEYGDERDPTMREFLKKISPRTNADRIRVPLMVVQGKNDPRVPLFEAEQIVQAVRGQGGTCWYLMAKDEGHGFAKKRNQDFQFLSTILFLQQHLTGRMD